jgi:hypothetical protein
MVGMNIDDLLPAESGATRAAREVAEAYCSPALLHHSIRSYLWAAHYATTHHIDFDTELMYVSSLLHDLGLTTAFDNHTTPFEEAGGDVAWVLAAGAGWSEQRRTRAKEIVVRHMWDHVDVAADPEGHLLELSTSLDISGRDADAWPDPFKAEVLDRYPRLDLATEFAAAFEQQAGRKPGCAAAAAVKSGIAQRLAANPLEAVVTSR